MFVAQMKNSQSRQSSELSALPVKVRSRIVIECVSTVVTLVRLIFIVPNCLAFEFKAVYNSSAFDPTSRADLCEGANYASPDKKVFESALEIL